MNEFELIRRYFTRPAHGANLGIGDDCALVEPSPGHELAISTDMLVEGRHFLPGDDPRDLGHKALAVNLSDLAAMGARPRWVFLALALPASEAEWVAPFADGFFSLAQRFEVELIGGDTTRGPRNLCLTVVGELPRGSAILRSGARPGDDVWVSGCLGEAALGLMHIEAKLELEPDELAGCLARLHRPEPRIALGLALRGTASAMLDVSDGITGDLGHLATASGVGAQIRIGALARAPAVSARLGGRDRDLALAALLGGGDDYELCFTAPAQRRDRIGSIAASTGVAVARVGEIVPGRGVEVIDEAGRSLTDAVRSFDHFA